MRKPHCIFKYGYWNIRYGNIHGAGYTLQSAQESFEKHKAFLKHLPTRSTCILANVNGTIELATVVSVGSDYIDVRAYERKTPKRVTHNSKINKVFSGVLAVKDAEAWIHAQRASNRDEEM